MKKHYTYRVNHYLLILFLFEILLSVGLFFGYHALKTALPELEYHNEQFLYLPFILPLLSVFYLLNKNWQRKAIARFSQSHLIGRLFPQISNFKTVTKFILIRLALTSIVIAAINPKLGSQLAEAKQEGVDIILAIDVSNSMLAEDFTPSRLGRAKLAISKLVDELHGDRIGMIVFAGDAFVQLPITTDYSAAKLFLNTISPEIVPNQGTAIGEAIELSLNSFDYESPASKSIIVITDGENHEDNAVKWAKNATDKNVIVHTIGMGSQKGAPIPIYRRGRKQGHKKDKNGQTVISKLNENMLKDIADGGDGIYVRASNAQIGLQFLLDEIETMETAEFSSSIYTDYQYHFQPFLLLAILLLCIEMLLTEKRNTWTKTLYHEE